MRLTRLNPVYATHKKFPANSLSNKMIESRNTGIFQLNEQVFKEYFVNKSEDVLSHYSGNTLCEETPPDLLQAIMTYKICAHIVANFVKSTDKMKDALNLGNSLIGYLEMESRELKKIAKIHRNTKKSFTLASSLALGIYELFDHHCPGLSNSIKLTLKDAYVNYPEIILTPAKFQEYMEEQDISMNLFILEPSSLAAVLSGTIEDEAKSSNQVKSGRPLRKPPVLIDSDSDSEEEFIGPELLTDSDSEESEGIEELSFSEATSDTTKLLSEEYSSAPDEEVYEPSIPQIPRKSSKIIETINQKYCSSSIPISQIIKDTSLYIKSGYCKKPEESEEVDEPSTPKTSSKMPKIIKRLNEKITPESILISELIPTDPTMHLLDSTGDLRLAQSDITDIFFKDRVTDFDRSSPARKIIPPLTSIEEEIAKPSSGRPLSRPPSKAQGIKRNRNTDIDSAKEDAVTTTKNLIPEGPSEYRKKLRSYKGSPTRKILGTHTALVSTSTTKGQSLAL
jgi:hypothetical protein